MNAERAEATNIEERYEQLEEKISQLSQLAQQLDKPIVVYGGETRWGKLSLLPSGHWLVVSEEIYFHGTNQGTPFLIDHQNNRAELQKLVYVVGWMRDCMPPQTSGGKTAPFQIIDAAPYLRELIDSIEQAFATTQRTLSTQPTQTPR